MKYGIRNVDVRRRGDHWSSDCLGPKFAVSAYDVGATIGRPICLGPQFAVSMVRRRGDHWSSDLPWSEIRGVDGTGSLRKTDVQCTPLRLCAVHNLVGATIGRPICRDTQFAVSMVRRRAGLYVPPCLALQKETVTQQSLYLVLTAVVNISSVAAGHNSRLRAHVCRSHWHLM